MKFLLILVCLAFLDSNVNANGFMSKSFDFNANKGNAKLCILGPPSPPADPITNSTLIPTGTGNPPGIVPTASTPTVPRTPINTSTGTSATTPKTDTALSLTGANTTIPPDETTTPLDTNTAAETTTEATTTANPNSRSLYIFPRYADEKKAIQDIENAEKEAKKAENDELASGRGRARGVRAQRRNRKRVQRVRRARRNRRRRVRRNRRLRRNRKRRARRNRRKNRRRGIRRIVRRRGVKKGSG